MIKGVDVSHHQDPKAVDYEAFREQGVEFVFARAAYGTKPDATFLQHVEKARAAGLHVGGYSFFRQTQDPQAQFDAFWRGLVVAECDLAPVLDLEWGLPGDGPTRPEAFRAGGELILSQLREEFGSAVVYIAPGFFETLGRPKWLLEYAWWVAHYTTPGKPWCPFKDWQIHQHTGKGRLKGYAKDIDLNVAKSLPLILSPDITPGLKPSDMRDEDFE